MEYAKVDTARAMVDLGYDSSYFKFVHVVETGTSVITHWSDESRYVPNLGCVRWSGRREIGVNDEGAWIRVIHWTREDGTCTSSEALPGIETLDELIFDVDEDEEIELEDGTVA